MQTKSCLWVVYNLKPWPNLAIIQEGYIPGKFASRQSTFFFAFPVFRGKYPNIRDCSILPVYWAGVKPVRCF